MALAGPLARAEARLASRRPLVAGSLVAAAIAVRLVYLAQASGTPLLDQHRSRASDMHHFDLWAQRIASGDLLVDEPFHPFHKWHDDLARQHFAVRPEAREALLAASDAPAGETAASRLLWQRWYGGKRFHQEPLYPYLLAASYALFGVDVRPLLVLQMGVGVLGVALVWLVGRRAFGDLAGGIAGALAVLYAPLLQAELVLLRDSMVATAGLGLVHLVQRTRARPASARWAALGVGCGAAILLKSSLALFAGIAGCALAWEQRHAGRALAARLGAGLAAAALVLAPAVARNLAVGAPALALSSVAAVTFVSANAADWGEEPGFVGEFAPSRHVAPIFAETDGATWASARSALATHEGVASYLGQLARKLSLLLWWYEIPNNESFDYFALHAPILRALPVTFLWVGPLGLLGLAFAAPRWRALWPLLLLLATSLAIALAFGVFGRLRLPLVPPLLPFAGLAVATLAERAFPRRIGAWIGPGLALAALLTIAARPLPEGRSRIRPTDYTTPFVTRTKPRAEAALARGDPCGAAAEYEALLATEPASIRALDGRRPPAGPADAMLAQFFRRMHGEHERLLDACAAAAPAGPRRQTLDAAKAEARRRGTQLGEALSLAPGGG